jgi:hypothetical protein
VDDIPRIVSGLRRHRGATEDVIADTENRLKEKLPTEYVQFVKLSNGGDGCIGGNAYVMLWGVDELPAMNQSYEVEKNAPGLLIFGSNGGGEAYGFDTRTPQRPIVEMPFIGMSWDLARPMGATFRDFLERLYQHEQRSEAARQGDCGGSDCQGKEIFEIKPVILGGSPTDPSNKALLTREEHIKAVIYWNRVIREMRG